MIKGKLRCGMVGVRLGIGVSWTSPTPVSVGMALVAELVKVAVGSVSSEIPGGTGVALGVTVWVNSGELLAPGAFTVGERVAVSCSEVVVGFQV